MTQIGFYWKPRRFPGGKLDDECWFLYLDERELGSVHKVFDRWVGNLTHPWKQCFANTPQECAKFVVNEAKLTVRQLWFTTFA